MIHTWGFKVNPLSQLWRSCFKKQGISEPPSNPPNPSRAYFFSVAEYLELSVAENPQNVKATFTSQLVDFQ